MQKLLQLLDNRYGVLLYRNALGSYTAVAIPPPAGDDGSATDWTQDDLDTTILPDEDDDDDAPEVLVVDLHDELLTDERTLEAAVSKLADKVLRLGEYAEGDDY